MGFFVLAVYTMYSRYSIIERDFKNAQKNDRITEQEHTPEEGVLYYVMLPYVYFGYSVFEDTANTYKTANMTEYDFYDGKKGSKNKLVPVIYVSRGGTDYINACSRLLELKTEKSQLCCSCFGSLSQTAIKQGNLVHKGCYANGGGLCDKVKDERDKKRRMLNAELGTQYRN